MGTYKEIQVEFDVSDLDDIREEIEELKEEMMAWQEGMEEKLSHTAKYEEVSDCCNILENLDTDGLRWPEELPTEIKLVVQWQNRNKNRPNSRSIRRDNIISKISAVTQFLREKHEEMLKVFEDDEEEGTEETNEIGELIDELDSIESDLASIEFPTMY